MTMSRLQTVCLAVGLCGLVEAKKRKGGSLSCLDAKGNEVDHWYVFRYPGGWKYAYMTNETELHKVATTADSENSPLSRTLQQVYDDADSLSYVMWNDEFPDGSKHNAPYAHSKGVAALDGDGNGIWLSHSLPKFPNAVSDGSPGFDTANTKYGQQFFCISVDKTAFTKLGNAMMINRPTVYDAADNAGAPEPFEKWALNKEYNKDDQTLYQEFKSRGGLVFYNFAKSGKWNDELYGSLVGVQFERDFETSTWLNGVGVIPSYCPRKSEKNKYSVLNVKEVQFPGESWTNSKDHSKWAVSKDGELFCAGDINRQKGQLIRGGGTICIHRGVVGRQMLKVVAETEPCKKTLASNFENVTVLV